MIEKGISVLPHPAEVVHRVSQTFAVREKGEVGDGETGKSALSSSEMLTAADNNLFRISTKSTPDIKYLQQFLGYQTQEYREILIRLYPAPRYHSIFARSTRYTKL